MDKKIPEQETRRTEIVLPVIQETVEISKRLVENRRLRFTRVVSEREEVVSTPVLRDEIQIEHVARNEVLTEPAQVRREGDILIIPVMEEVTVVEKRLMLVEELRIRTTTVEVPQEQTVTLRREEVQIEEDKPGRPGVT